MNIETHSLFYYFLAFQLNSQQARDFAKGSVSSSKAWIDVDMWEMVSLAIKWMYSYRFQGYFFSLLVVTIYGNAWLSNSSKSAIFNDGLGQKLLAKGYAVASLNHRSSTDAAWPAQLHDVKAAIRFIKVACGWFINWYILHWNYRLFIRWPYLRCLEWHPMSLKLK